MYTNEISATNSYSSSIPGRETPKKTVEKDMFMTLLVAQLKNQDPLQPQDGAAFVAQLAQFNSLEQLTNIGESMQQLNGIKQAIDKLTALLQNPKTTR